MEYKILPSQIQLCTSSAKETLLLGGIGSGKSFGIAPLILTLAGRHPDGCLILLAANTYSQLVNSTVEAVKLGLNDFNVKYDVTISGATKHITIGKTKVLLYSLENYEVIKGLSIDYAIMDEFGYSKKEALQTVRGRMRGRKAKKHQIFITTTPNGYNFLYDEYGNIKQNEDKKVIHALTRDNVFLPEGYYENKLEEYGGESSPLAQQELFGKFVNLQEGSIYCHFKRELNTKKLQLDKGNMVFVGVDFNIDNMSAVYCQYINGVFKLVKEVKLKGNNSNTFDLGQRIIKDLQGYSIQVVPDSTGSSRKTSATKTDIQILKDLGLNIAQTSNPFCRDRQTTLNMLFLKGRCIIDTECNETIREIETLSSRDDEGKKTHLQVCLGYVTWYLEPMKPKQTPSRTISNY